MIPIPEDLDFNQKVWYHLELFGAAQCYQPVYTLVAVARSDPSVDPLLSRPGYAGHLLSQDRELRMALGMAFHSKDFEAITKMKAVQSNRAFRVGPSLGPATSITPMRRVATSGGAVPTVRPSPPVRAKRATGPRGVLTFEDFARSYDANSETTDQPRPMPSNGFLTLPSKMLSYVFRPLRKQRETFEEFATRGLAREAKLGNDLPGAGMRASAVRFAKY